MTMSRRQVLEYWILCHEELTPDQRHTFLARDEVSYMTRCPTKSVRAALAANRKLADAYVVLLDEFDPRVGDKSLSPGESSAKRLPEPHERDPATRGLRDPERRRKREPRRDPGRPAPLLDTETHRKIGPTQSYDDSF